MADRRHNRTNWQLTQARVQTDGSWTVPNETVTHALLMDIRDQLDVLVRTLNCAQFQAIPRRLESIERNTRPKTRHLKLKRRKVA